MSGKTVQLKHHEKWGWWLSWGNETFYAADRTMRRWEQPSEALEWLKANYAELRLVQTDDVPESDQDENDNKTTGAILMCIRCDKPSHYDLCKDCYQRWMRVLQKLEAVAEQLQHGAYEQQMRGRTKPLKQFLPCSKGTTITKRLGDYNAVIIGVLQEAAMAHCSCHNSMNLDDLMAMVPDMNELAEVVVRSGDTQP